MNKSSSESCGCLIAVALLIVICFDGWWKWIVIAFLALIIVSFLINYFVHEDKKTDKTCFDASEDKEQNKSCELFRPNFRIRYESGDGDVTTRDIYIKKINGIVVSAYCFLRQEERTFVIDRIMECVDLESREKIDGDLKIFFLNKYKNSACPSNFYTFDEWNDLSYSKLKPVSEEVGEFELNEKFKMKFATYKEGFVEGEFLCLKVKVSSYLIDMLYVVVLDDSGVSRNVGLSKIVYVEGIEDFNQYLQNKFYKSDDGKLITLFKNFANELSILVYLGRADSSLTAKKKSIIFEYLNSIGANCSEEVFSKACRKIKLDLSDFKKMVLSFSKCIAEEKKYSFVSVCESVVGDIEKAKPFGLAGLQYVKSKIK